MLGEEPFVDVLGRRLALRSSASAAPARRRRGLRGAARRRLRPLRGAIVARPAGRVAGALVLGGQLEEVLGDLQPVLGRDRLGVELDAPDRPLGVLDPHHDAVVGPGDDAAFGAGRAGDRQRVVADDREALRHVLEEALAFVHDPAEAAVHRHRRAA